MKHELWGTIKGGSWEAMKLTMNHFVQFDEDEYHDVRKDEQASSTA